MCQNEVRDFQADNDDKRPQTASQGVISKVAGTSVPTDSRNARDVLVAEKDAGISTLNHSFIHLRATSNEFSQVVNTKSLYGSYDPSARVPSESLKKARQFEESELETDSLMSVWKHAARRSHSR